MFKFNITELCTIGRVTKSQYEPVEADDPVVQEEIKLNGKGLRGFLEKCGLPRKKVMRPKRRIYQKHVGEKPSALGELCDYGGDAPAYALYYCNRIANPCDSDKRPRGDEAEILLPQELAYASLSAVERNPAFIRRIVARMVDTVLDTSEAEWLHKTPDSHGAFGIAYDEWRCKGRLYVHGPDAPKGYYPKYVREISNRGE